VTGRTTVDIIPQDGDEARILDVTGSTVYPGSLVSGFTPVMRRAMCLPDLLEIDFAPRSRIGLGLLEKAKGNRTPANEIDCWDA
jgi:hypothetical protein